MSQRLAALGQIRRAAKRRGTIVAEAAAIKADLAGVTFHVGSQCRNADNWRIGIDRAKKLFRRMRLAGLNPRLLNIAAAIRCAHTKPIPSIETIGAVVNHGSVISRRRCG
jgi:ornithine decarboxylase